MFQKVSDDVRVLCITGVMVDELASEGVGCRASARFRHRQKTSRRL